MASRNVAGAIAIRYFLGASQRVVEKGIINQKTPRQFFSVRSMADSATLVSETDILAHAVDAIECEQLVSVARVLSRIGLPESDLDRVDDLLSAKADRELSAEEEEELQKYLRVGNFLDMLRARAVRILSEQSG